MPPENSSLNPKPIPRGSVIQGTYSIREQLEAFWKKLVEIRGVEVLRLDPELKDIELQLLVLVNGQWEATELLEMVDTLRDHLETEAANYWYFGTHIFEKDHWGFWLRPGFIMDARENGSLQVDDTSEVPAEYVGEVLHINDHGNATLYLADGKGDLKELWSVV